MVGWLLTAGIERIRGEFSAQHHNTQSVDLSLSQQSAGQIRSRVRPDPGGVCMRSLFPVRQDLTVAIEIESLYFYVCGRITRAPVGQFTN